MEKSPCHIKRGPLCLNKKIDDMPLEFFKAYVSYMKMTQPALFINNTECVSNIYTKLYWTSIDKINEADSDEDKFGLYLFLGIAIGAVFVIAILLLVIYFKRRKSDEDEAEETTTGKMVE